MYNIISKLSKVFEKIAIDRLITYHGTSAKNLPSIAREGLKAFKPGDVTWSTKKGVYLTNNIEAAARYATSRYGSSQYPVVLEIVISSPRHIRKITLDPLDSESDLYDNHEWTAWDDSITYLNDSIKKVLGHEGRFRRPPIDIEPDIDKLNGLEIYRMIIDYAKNNKLSIRDIKQKLKKEMPPGTNFEDFEISESGTLKLTPIAYDKMHQMIYPKSLPTISIKAIWVPATVLNPIFKSLANDSNTFGSKLLSGEIGEIQNKFNSIYVYKPEELPGALEQIREFWVVQEGHVDISDLEQAVKEQDVDQFNDTISWISNEDFGSFDTVVNKQTWFKFEIGGKLTVDNAISLYKTTPVETD